jgi:hypothetical protein
MFSSDIEWTDDSSPFWQRVRATHCDFYACITERSESCFDVVVWIPAKCRYRSERHKTMHDAKEDAEKFMRRMS